MLAVGDFRYYQYASTTKRVAAVKRLRRRFTQYSSYSSQINLSLVTLTIYDYITLILHWYFRVVEVWCKTDHVMFLAFKPEYNVS